MDAIKQLLEKKRQAKDALDTGGKKYVKHSAIEEARLKRLREEEEQETLAKVCRGCLPLWLITPTPFVSTKCSCRAYMTLIPQCSPGRGDTASPLHSALCITSALCVTHAGAQEEAEDWRTAAAAAAEN